MVAKTTDRWGGREGEREGGREGGGERRTVPDLFIPPWLASAFPPRVELSFGDNLVASALPSLPSLPPSLPPSLAPSLSIATCMKKMLAKDIRHLPVVDDEKKEVVGMLSIKVGREGRREGGREEGREGEGTSGRLRGAQMGRGGEGGNVGGRRVVD